MPRKSVVKSRCALCGAKEVSEPRGEEKYCRDCWDKKIAVEEIVAREFALKRYIRAHSAEKYLIYHSTLKRPCGQLIVVDDGYDLFLTLMLYPNFGWDEPAYHLEGDPEGRLFSEILVDVVAAEVIEPWGGGKWHMEIFRTVAPGTGRLEWRNVALERRGAELQCRCHLQSVFLEVSYESRAFRCRRDHRRRQLRRRPRPWRKIRRRKRPR